MAITEHQIPQEYTPVYNDMFHVVKSNNTALPNFRYLFKVYVNGNYINRIFKRSPHPTYGTGVFDVKDIISPYITHDIDLDNDAFLAADNTHADYYIKYGEEYGDLSSGVTQYNDLATSTAVTAFAGSLKGLEFIDYDKDDYLMDSSGSMFMTNRPRPGARLFNDQKAFLGIMTDTLNIVDQVWVRTYSISGSLLNTFKINNGVLAAGNFYRVIAGWNLNDIDNSAFASGSQPVLDSNVHHYTLQIYNGGVTPVSEVFRFDLDTACDWDDSYTLHFQNVLGFFDSFMFTRSNTREHEMEKKYYKKSTGTFGATSFTVTKQDRASTQYYTADSDKWTLRSTYLTQAESAWLWELVSSPMVYIEINNELIPVNIPATNYAERKRTEAGEPFSLELQVDFSVKNYRQKG